MRYVVAAAVALVAALLLIGVLRSPLSHQRGDETFSDELLAYVITAKFGVTIGLLQRTKEIRLTSWSVVEKATPEERFDYSLRVEWQDAESRPLGEDLLTFESRVSQANHSMDPRAFAARLAYSNSLVTDSRTMRVLVPTFDGKLPAQMRLRLKEDGRRVLMRVTYPDLRQSLEVTAADQRLSARERQELVRDRTSVSWDELPLSLRAVALGTWQRRLDASGIEGKDYAVERILIGSGRSTAGLSTAQRPGMSVDRHHSVALNVLHPVSLSLQAPAHSALLVTTTADPAPKSILVDEGGRAMLTVGRADYADTVVIASSSVTPVPIQLGVAAQDAGAFLNPSAPSEDVEIRLLAPLLRRSNYYQLDPDSPVTVLAAAGQAVLGLLVRGVATTSFGKLDAEIDGNHATIDVTLVASSFEQWSDLSPATDEQRLYVRLPEGTRRIQLRGSASLRVSPFTIDPEVTADRIALEYDVALPPESHWKYARYDIDRAVSLKPDNERELTADSRTWELIAQSRIERRRLDPDAPESTLHPTAATVERQVIEPLRWGPDVSVPEDAVLALNEARRAHVPSKGARAGRVRVSYRLAFADVGEPLELLVDRAVVHREESVANSGQFTVPVAPGPHLFELRGARADTPILLEAIPLQAAGALRRRVVHRILPQAVLRYVIPKHAEALRVVITTYQPRERRVALRYAIQGDRRSDFFHVATPAKGEISGIALEAPGSWFWEAGPERPLTRHRSVIAIGADLRPGLVALVLRNLNPSPVYVALVLVGQADASRPQLQRFWTMEDPG